MEPSRPLEKLLAAIKRIIPRGLFLLAQPPYHYLLAFLAALAYRFPSRNLFVVAISGTKGKTTTAELANALLEEAGFRTALASTLRIKIGTDSKRNLYKMTLPGRFFLQRFLRRAAAANCQYAIIEMTSEAVRQFRHKFIKIDAFIFTNLSPEHIESHGSYENYVSAKFKIAKALEHSRKGRRILVVNGDDGEAKRFLSIRIPKKQKYVFSLKDAEPYELHKDGVRITVAGKKIKTNLVGVFNIYNALAATTFAKTQKIPLETVKTALEKFRGVPGRVEEVSAGQNFTAIVDYAHTPDSLEKLYRAFEGRKKICVLGATGGGRDKWKRKVMGSIADKYCSFIILTNEDPYDEDPREIIGNVSEGIHKKSYLVALDRREAMRRAFELTKKGEVVLITGKGTDPYIMGPNGTRISWDDRRVAEEELARFVKA